MDEEDPKRMDDGFDPYGQRGWQPGPGMPAKSRQYTKLGITSWPVFDVDFRFDKV